MMLLCLKPSNESPCQKSQKVRPSNNLRGPMSLSSFILVSISSLISFLFASFQLHLPLLFFMGVRMYSSGAFALAVLLAWNTFFVDSLMAHFLCGCVFNSLIKCWLPNVVLPDYLLQPHTSNWSPTPSICFILLLPQRALVTLEYMVKFIYLRSLFTIWLFY